MDTKANLSAKRKLNDLASQHNKLTTLVACLLNEVNYLKKEISDLKSNSNTNLDTNSKNNFESSYIRQNPNKFTNFNDLKAEDILKQLSINSSDN